MTQRHALFAVYIPSPERLAAIFGEAAVAQALADFGNSVDAFAARLLAQHEVMEPLRDLGGGMWAAVFRVVDGGLPRDTGETCAAIELAGRKSVHRVTSQVFGAGTALRVDADLCAFALGSDDLAAFFAQPGPWLAKRLEGHQRPGFWNPDVRASDLISVMHPRAARTVLQPIGRMDTRAVLGYEALTRGPAGSPLERPDVLFDAAHVYGLSADMELLCAELALERTQGRIPEGQFLTINLGPEARARAGNELPLAGRAEVLFELTEHMPLDEAEGLAGAGEGLRGQGVGLALDDTGCGFADMDTARILKPDIVKLCITVVRNADQGGPFLSAIRDTTQALHDLGLRVLAEGVETEDQHQALAGCAIELAQGWLYARPAPVDEVLG